MGKATRWFKGLLHSIKSSDPSPSTPPTTKVKRRWSFVKSKSSSLNPNPNPSDAADDNTKHAIVVAAASAAAAEAAVATAQAAAAVVRLTTSGRRYTPPSAHVSAAPTDRREIWAVLVIQSHFRGYLARRALRALKGLVKLQALVRGHIMRKKTADTMRSIQAMLRAQARARSVRAYDSPSSSGKSSHIHHPGPPTPEKFEHTFHTRNMSGNQSAMLKGNGSRSVHRVLIHPDNGYVNSTWSGPQLGEPMWATGGRYTHNRTGPCCSAEDYYVRPDKILEVDTGKPRQFGPKHRKSHFESRGHDFGSDQLTPQSFTTTTSKDSTTYPATVLSPGSCEVQSGLNMKTLKLSVQEDDEEGQFCTAENSPRFYSSASKGGSTSTRRRGSHTPTKSDASATSCFSGYSDCPSYMAYTESSRAKMRSMSAPRQRPQPCYERTSSTKRWSVHQQRAVGLGPSSSSAAMHASFASKAYPGSGRLDRLGMPVRSNGAVVYYSGYLN